MECFRILLSNNCLRSIGGNIFASVGILCLSTYCGMVAYAKYFDCDPLTSKVMT